MSDTYFPLHPAQQEVYTDQLLNTDSPLYNIGGYIVLKGDLNKDKFHEVINSAPADLDFFKLRFDLQNPDFLCHYDERFNTFQLEELDFSAEDHPQEAARLWTQERFNISFRLGKEDCPFEQYLLKISENEHWFFGKYHHLICDGYGFIVWVQYIANKYHSLIAADGTQFSYPLYKDEAIKAGQYLNSSSYEIDSNYWKDKISHKPEKLLHKNYRMEASGTANATFIHKVILADEKRKLLEDLQSDTKSSLQQLTLAALLIYFGTTTGKSEFIFGVPIHKRGSRVLRNIVGMFSGILPFKGSFNENASLIDLLAEISGIQRSDYRHQNYPIGDLSRHLKINNSEGYLYDVVVNYEPLHFELNFDQNIDASIVRLANDDERNPLQLAWRDYGTQQPLELQIHFSEKCFSKEEIQLLAERIIFIIEQFPEALNNSIGTIPILPVKEAERLSTFQINPSLYPRDKSITDLFTEQAIKCPESIAVVFGTDKVSYQELDDRSNQLAHYLLLKGVKPGLLLPICAERGINMIVSILAILKAGAAYVPLDSAYPDDRLAFMLQDTAAGVIVCSKTNRPRLEKFTGVEIVEPDGVDAEMISTQPVTDLPHKIDPGQLAYVIYTSGSTGKPKGVLVEHRNVVSLVKGVNYVDLDEKAVLLVTGSTSFDATTFEYWSMLLNGGRLILCSDDELLDNETLKKLIRDNRVTTMWFTSSWFNQLTETDITLFEGLKTILVGGEQLSEEHIRNFRQQYRSVRIINGYGPTENTTFSLTHEVGDLESKDAIPIGRPVSNCEAYVLSNNLRLLPIGVAGEICLGGAGLSRGYLNREELTHDKFVRNPFSEIDEDRIYKTGDLGRWLPDGSLEYLGRLDEQVKIRGYRIEPGEIESVLKQSGLVSQGVVVARNDTKGVKRLVAYVVPDKDSFNKEVIQNYLAARLPEYMVPTIWVELDRIPLTLNGKTDKQALPEPDIINQISGGYIAPQTLLETKLVQIWQQLLGLSRVGIQDNFFELGGDSILAIQAVSRVRRLGYELQPRDIFAHQTIGRLAHVLASQSGAVISGEQGILTGPCGLLAIQQWYLEKNQKSVSHFNQSVLLTVNKAVTAAAFQEALQQLLNHHDALRFTYTKTTGQWDQIYGSAVAELAIEDLRTVTAGVLAEQITTRADQYQRSLDIEQGKLMRVVLIYTPDNEEHNRFLIVIHHLAVDGVSWRILLEDLGEYLRNIVSGQDIHLATKGSSYRQWHEALKKYSSSQALLSQIEYWKKVVSSYQPLIVDKLSTEHHFFGQEQQYVIGLGTDRTRALLQEVPKAYNTEINDILLAALTVVMRTLTGRNTLVIGLEGHGRENIAEDVDTSRTVGWFTSIFPVMLEITEAHADKLITDIKEQLRQIPDRGLGYGVLKYINKEEALKNDDPWDISFNYLGQLDNVLEENGLLGLANENTGSSVSEDHIKTAKISIESCIRNGELVLQWNFSAVHYHFETIKQLAESYKIELIHLIEHCVTKKVTAILNTDGLGLRSGISHEELSRFMDEPFKGKKRVDTIEDIYPLSALQEGMLFHGLYSTESGAYISQFTLDLYKVDLSNFEKSWKHVLQSHNIFRSAFYHKAFGIPVQCVYRQVDLEIVSFDYSNLTEEEKILAIEQYLNTDSSRGFDFEKAPLTRFAMIRLTSEKYKMIWTTHHMIFDGWSLPVLVEEFFNNYQLLDTGREIPEKKVDDYGEYIHYLQQIDKAEQEKYWRTYLAGIEKSTQLPFIKNLTGRTKGVGSYQSLAIQPDATMISKIKSYTQKNHITLNTLMQGVWAWLLHRYTGSSDVVFGIIVSGRPDEIPQVEQRVGLYVNTLPLRVSIADNEPLDIWLTKLQADQLRSREFQYTALPDIQQWSGLSGELFDSLLVFENYPVNQLITSKEWVLQVSDVQMREQTNYPLTILITNSEQLAIHFNYNSDILETPYVEAIKEQFEQALLQIACKEPASLSDISLLTPAQEEQLDNFNNTVSNYPIDKSLVDLFQEQVLKSATNIAVAYEEHALTYQELNERSNQLAHFLLAEGVSDEMLVPVCLERGIKMIVSILGILKAGAAFIPVDPEYPSERIVYMLEDSGARLVVSSICSKDVIKTTAGLRIIEIDGSDRESISLQTKNNRSTPVTPNQLAYVIYTSGSTGKPKGVMIEHTSVINLLKCIASEVNFRSDNSVLSVTTYSFDICYLEFFMPLTTGARLIIASREVAMDGFKLAHSISQFQPTHMQATPSTWQLLLDAGWQNNEGIKMLIGGEAVKDIIKDSLTSIGDVFNVYGPTETTIWSTIKKLSSTERVVIGKPLWNTGIYILDKNQKLNPVGISGEICIGGAGLARGYLNQAELTATKFIKHPFNDEPDTRLYKTGDLGRWLPDGDLEYLGRMDDQIKIRGYRIELGEIEAIILQSGLVKQAIVLAKEDKNANKCLVGYIVADSFDKELVQAHLRGKLPEYMVPTIWVELESLPLTPNGKIDKKSLPDPDLSVLHTTEYAAPTNLLEQQLVEIWQTLLKIDRIGTEDNFFELGGHSLLAMRLISSLRKALKIELGVKELFTYPTISELAAYINRENLHQVLPPIEVVPRPEFIPLSFSQERLWLVDQLEGSLQYHITAVIRLHGELNAAGLEHSLKEIVNRHEILRTVYLEDQGRAYQKVKPTGSWRLLITQGQDFQKDKEALDKYIAMKAQVPFDLSNDHMFRAELIRLSETEHVLLVMMHHIASDAWSMPILVSETAELYESFIQKRAANLTVLPLQFSDYAIWQKDYLKGEVLDTKIAYWKGKLEGVEPLQLPTDYVRPAEMSTRGASSSFVIPPELSSQLQSLSQKRGATLYMTLLSAFKVLLHRYSGQEDICVGTSIAGRPQQELESLIGFFVNTLALRSKINANNTFTSLLEDVKTTMLEAYAHQEVPFERVVEQVVKERDSARSPLFQVMLVLRNTPEVPQLQLGDLVLTGEPYEHTTVKFDLTFFLTETVNGIEGSVLYSTDLFRSERIERMMKHFTRLLQSIVSSPEEIIGKLKMLSHAEETELKGGYNLGRAKRRKDKTPIELFENQAARFPDTIALAYEGLQLTFSELNTRSNQVAHYLKDKGVRADTLVPLFVERGVEMIVGMLGILKAGGAYVPIDTDFPEDRIRYMLDDTSADIVLGTTSSRKKLTGTDTFEFVNLDGDGPGLNHLPTENLNTNLAAEQLLYVIYTSGSTGKPKGVLITQGNMLDYIKGLDECTEINDCESYALVSTMATDLGNTVLFSWLVSGGTLHVFSKEMVSHIENLHRYFNQHRIECLKIVPSHWKALLKDGEALLPSHLLIFGGESLQGDVIRTIRETGSDCRVVNHYGPTETTVGKLLNEVDLDREYGLTVPIGKPFSDTTIYVLNASGSVCPIGVPGELHIGGAGVARGYLNNPELTAEKFVNDPFGNSGKVYKTGDLVSYDDEGNIMFLGRVDDQVKIRGYRVEPGEIGRILEGCDLVSQAVVISDNDHQGNKQLIGYIVPVDTFDREEIIAYAKENLPDYMVPAHLIELESIPLTANGKVDRKALPALDSTEQTGEYVAPRTEIEIKLAEIWQDVLEVDQVGAHDDFFELGGHSLLAVRLISAVRKAFKAELPIGDVFDYPTVATLAERLSQPAEGADTTVNGITAVTPRPEVIPLSFSQERLWFIDRMEGSVQYHVPSVLRLKGNLNLTALNAALNEIVSRHEVLRTTIREKDGQAYQIIKEAGKWQLTKVEGTPYQKNAAALEGFIQQIIREPFDLSKDDMIRGHLITLSEQEFVLVVNLHHIASDGWSRSILVRELVILYKSFDQGITFNLEPLELQYADYAIWQRGLLQGEQLDNKLAYWKKKLDGITVLDLPTDYVRPTTLSTKGAIHTFDIEPELTDEIHALSKSQGTTLYMTLLAAYKVMLHRYSGQEDICVGSGIAGRNHQELEGLIGFFVNTLAMRSHVLSDMPFTELLQAVKVTTMEAYDHQEVPFEKVVDAVVRDRDISRNPVFQVTFVVQNTPDVPELRLGDLALTVENYDHVTTKFDITFSVTEVESGLQVIAEYNTDLYEKRSIERMSGHFVNLLKSITESPEQKIGLLLMLSAEEEALLLGLNPGQTTYPKDKNLAQLFEEQAAKTPDEVALVLDQEHLTYKQLNEKSNQLA
ncbi:MAG TPA: amino acid adenylation domain-containing protein, partial [Pedobacter sp.]